MDATVDEQKIFSIERPCPKLMTYYALSALMAGPFFPIVLIPLYFKYHTLRYRFDREGISMQWGILFRREIILNYSRIQDIHLKSNILERWLGLAKVQIQTASGSASAEMTIEGLHEFEAVRDFLYSKMRGLKEHGGAHHSESSVGTDLSSSSQHQGHDEGELAAALRETAAELRMLRLAIEAKNKDPKASRDA